MKSKGKQKLFQSDWWTPKDGECSYGKFWKRFRERKTCRFMKHKKRVEFSEAHKGA